MRTPSIQKIVRDQEAILGRLRVIAEKIEATGNGHPSGNGHRNGRSAALKLQGRYMGLTRLMGPRLKARYRRIRQEHGYTAAIRAIQKARG